MIDAAHVDREVEDMGVAVGERIEDADLDVGVCVECCYRRIAPLEEDVVDKDTDPDTTVRRLRDPLREDASGGVGLPDEILKIEALLGEVDEGDAGRERLAPPPDQREAGLARMLLCLCLEELAKLGLLVAGIGGGRRPRVVRGQAGAAREEQQDEKGQCVGRSARHRPGSRPVSSPIRRAMSWPLSPRAVGAVPVVPIGALNHLGLPDAIWTAKSPSSAQKRKAAPTTRPYVVTSYLKALWS